MELALGAILLVLMYEKPHAFTEFANSLLGKAIMIIAVGISFLIKVFLLENVSSKAFLRFTIRIEKYVIRIITDTNNGIG